MMTGPKHLVQPNAAAGQTSGNNLIPGSHKFRQARRAAAGLNHQRIEMTLRFAPVISILWWFAYQETDDFP
jgi:hypothetical protein